MAVVTNLSASLLITRIIEVISLRKVYYDYMDVSLLMYLVCTAQQTVNATKRRPLLFGQQFSSIWLPHYYQIFCLFKPVTKLLPYLCTSLVLTVVVSELSLSEERLKARRSGQKRYQNRVNFR